MNVVDIPLTSIVKDDAFVIREVPLDDDVVVSYEDSWKRGDEFPPIIVQVIDGSDKYMLIDGAHRVASLGRAFDFDPGLRIKAIVMGGDRSDALVAAIGANSKHGKPLSKLDKIRSLMMLLESGLNDRPNGYFADLVGLSVNTIEKYREGDETPRIRSDGRKVGKRVRHSEEEKKEAEEASKVTFASHTEKPVEDVAKTVLDMMGIPVPEDRLEAFSTIQVEINSVVEFINKAILTLDLVCSKVGSEWIKRELTPIGPLESRKYRSLHLASLIKLLNGRRPYCCYCPYCMDNPKPDCKVCLGLPYVPKSVILSSTLPRELLDRLKAMAENGSVNQTEYQDNQE